MKSGSERVMQSGALHTVLPAQPRSAQVHTPLWEEALAACAGGGPPHGRRMEDAIDCAEIATLTQLDVRDVEEIVRIHCHNDRDETNRAVAQFFDGVGPFIEEASNAWKSGGSKNKSRKSDEESTTKDDRRPRRGKGDGDGGKGSRVESRGRGRGDGEGRSRGRGGRGRSDDDVERPQRPPRNDAQRSDPPSKPVENGSPALNTSPPPEAPTPSDVPKPVVPAKPVGNAWAKPKDWSEQFIDAAQSVQSVAGRERVGRGRGGKGERKGKGDNSEEADRGRGRGRKGVNPADDAGEVDVNGVEDTPSDLAADLQSVMAQDAPLSSLPMPQGEAAQGANSGLPMMSSLTSPGEHGGSSAAPASSILLTDPAILGMSGAPSVGPCDGSHTDSAGVIMPTKIMGDSSKLQFGFGDASTAAAASAQPSQMKPPTSAAMQKLSFGLGGVDLSSSDLVDSICKSASGTSLPMPASLVNALPSAGGSSLPGFEGSSDSASMGNSPAEKMLASKLEKLAANESAALASLPSALAGLMQPRGLSQSGAFESVPAPAISNTSSAPVPGSVPPGVGRPVSAAPGHAASCSHPSASSIGVGVGIAPYTAMGPGMGLPPGAYADPPGTMYSAENGMTPTQPMDSMMPPGNMGFDGMGMTPPGIGAAVAYELPSTGNLAPQPPMAGRQVGSAGSDKEGPRRGRKKNKGDRGGGAAPASSGERNDRTGSATGQSQAMHNGGEMGMPPGIGMGMGVNNATMSVSAGQAPPSMIQPGYAQQQPYGFGMVPPALMAGPYTGYGGMPHGYGSGMYQVPAMPPGNINMYSAPAHNNYAPQPQYVSAQQQYVQQQQYLSQQCVARSRARSEAERQPWRSDAVTLRSLSHPLRTLSNLLATLEPNPTDPLLVIC